MTGTGLGLPPREPASAGKPLLGHNLNPAAVRVQVEKGRGTWERADVLEHRCGEPGVAVK